MSNILKKVLRVLRDAAYVTTIPSRIYALKLVREARRARGITNLVDVAFNIRMPLLRQMNIKPIQVYLGDLYSTRITMDP